MKMAKREDVGHLGHLRENERAKSLRRAGAGEGGQTSKDGRLPLATFGRALPLTVVQRAMLPRHRWQPSPGVAFPEGES